MPIVNIALCGYRYHKLTMCLYLTWTWQLWAYDYHGNCEAIITMTTMCRTSISWSTATSSLHILLREQRSRPCFPWRKVGGAMMVSWYVGPSIMSTVAVTSWWGNVLLSAIERLEYDTRHWPLVYNDTLVFTLKQVCPLAVTYSWPGHCMCISSRHMACTRTGT